MRRSLVGLFVFGLVACNAILGNEDHYTLLENGAGGDAGKAGSVAKAGTGGRAGEAGTGEAGTGEGGLAGASAEAGSGGAGEEAGNGGSSSGGTAGGSRCVATGAEDCFNGKDDDCNGATDCADAACTPSSSCVPNAVDGELGTLLPTGSSTCPTGYSAVTLHRGLTVDPYCTGCTCGTSTSYCTTSIVGHGTFACPSFQTSGLSYNMFTTSCQLISPGTSVHHYEVASFTNCPASGTATPSAPQWGETATYCKADRVGGGCKSGSSCVPKATSAPCARKTGNSSCTGAYATSSGAVWNTGVNDSRSCGTCTCAGGYGTCSNASVQVYSDASCSGTPTTISGAEGDECPLPFPPASGRVSGTPVPKQCVPNLYAGGTIEGTGASTVCCQ